MRCRDLGIDKDFVLDADFNKAWEEKISSGNSYKIDLAGIELWTLLVVIRFGLNNLATYEKRSIQNVGERLYDELLEMINDENNAIKIKLERI